LTPPVASSPTPQLWGEDPIAEFERRLAAAAPSEHESGTAMSLATVDESGRPAVRIVLLKAVGPRGFSFFTNYGSRKARELESSTQAALCFFWPSIYQQVRVEGSVERLPEGESDAYFASRPRGSQAGAWASRQSEPLADRQELVDRLADVEARFADREIPRPPFWGGFLLRPQSIEFWVGEESRLHQRRRYERHGDHWHSEGLFP